MGAEIVQLFVKAPSPPGPRGRFLLGSLPGLRRNPLAFLTEVARGYGDVAAFRVLGVPVWLLSHPDEIELVLATESRSFVKRRGLQAGRPIFGEGLLTSEGEFWRRQRRLAQPAFHRERLVGYGATMVSCTEAMLDGWTDGEIRDIHADLMRLTLTIVGETLFGSDVSGEARAVSEALETAVSAFPEMLNPVRRFFAEHVPTGRNRKLRDAVMTLERVVYDLIRARRESGQDSGDLLSALLFAVDEDGNRMDDRQLRDETLTLLLAGHETTAIALAWTFWLLGKNAGARAMLEEEVDRVLDGRDPGPGDLPRLTFTDWSVREAMRLYPPAWAIGRTAVADVNVRGFRIPKGASVLVSPWVTHHDPRFFESPEEFRPQRWGTEEARRLPRFAYFPFGGGPRACIGSGFATMEAVLVTATIWRRFRLERVPGHAAVPWPSITLRPRDGIRMLVERRRDRDGVASSTRADPLRSLPRDKHRPRRESRK